VKKLHINPLRKTCKSRLSRVLLVVLLSTMAISGYAQSGTNSPYSQFGLGSLAEQASGFNRGMNGLAIGFHDGNQVNYINPASYAYVDSLTFLFDMGLSGQITNFSENGTKRNAKQANFEYAVAGFRLAKHLGMSFGILPYTNVGYDYSSTGYVDSRNSVIYTNTYSGSGGLHQVYGGLGWAPFKNFSIGFNVGYLWGEITRSISNSYSDNYANTLSKNYDAEVRSYMVSAGLQYDMKLSKKDILTIGLTYSLGHKIGGDPTCRVISTNSQTSVSDSIVLGGNNLKLEVPHTFGVGFLYNHDNRLRLGADYNLQKWGSVSFPEYQTVSDNQVAYVMNDSYFKDRHKFTVGTDYVPDPTSRSFFSRIHYRAGVSYATPYLKINGKDGPNEISGSIGFGIPIINSYNNRSILNISAQIAHSSADGMITENIFRINIGLTFNEKWFQKWKVE
jgi:hypothetical protein